MTMCCLTHLSGLGAELGSPGAVSPLSPLPWLGPRSAPPWHGPSSCCSDAAGTVSSALCVLCPARRVQPPEAVVPCRTQAMAHTSHAHACAAVHTHTGSSTRRGRGDSGWSTVLSLDELLQPCQSLTVVCLQLLDLQLPKEKHIEIIQTQ